jgi:zinc D-Ala-D-Ala carboxypeptidase
MTPMQLKKTSATGALLAAAILLTAGCGSDSDKSSAVTASPSGSVPPAATASPSSSPVASTSPSPSASASVAPNKSPAPTATKSSAAAPTANTGGAVQVAAQPDSITVLVNKQFKLPDNYEPKDLVYPNVAFTFKEQSEKRKMRKEAAKALEELFDGAKKDGYTLLGVSAYRSYETQKTLFNNYVKKDGEEKAKTYSAVPGFSEHETGLAIDVTGGDGKCAAEDCFGDTKEADWLAKNAADYGFIIRFLKGKESVTGYQYEPWHIRYVGTKAAQDIAAKKVTLEEYLNAVPVSATANPKK